MQSKPSQQAARWKIFLAGAVIVLAALTAYHNSLLGPFVFDDSSAIIENPTIRHLWSVADIFSPPAERTVGGRPVINLSLAINYALGGTEVWGYHAMNLAIHLLAGLVLFGIVRRTLVLRVAGDDSALQSEAAWLGFTVALLWTVHPLQTESVTYTVQRAESLMGLFYLLTLYCFLRGVEGSIASEAGQRASPVQTGSGSSGGNNPRTGRRRWFALSIGACLLGMATKEVMVSAPVIVLLFDRTFVAGTFRDALERRERFYLGLASTWLLLAFLFASTGGNRGGTTGTGTGTTFGAYALTQFPAVVKYLRLSVWPHPLVFDYGVEWVKDAVDAMPAALVVISLIVGTVVALKRWPVIGFIGAWFFCILAPTSLTPGARQTMAEHRMYLALAAVLSLLVLGLYSWAGRRSLVIWLVAAVGLGWLTVERNRDFQSELAIWSDTVAKRPGNQWTQVNLGMVLYNAGRTEEALQHFEKAIQIDPNESGSQNDLGLALAKLGRMHEAVTAYETALRLWPNFAEAHNNLGLALSDMNRPGEAMVHLERALQLKPQLDTVHFNLGNTLIQLGRMEEAVIHFREAIKINPQYAASYANLGTALFRTGWTTEAIRQYETAICLDPQDVKARFNLAVALTQVGRIQDAITRYEEVLRFRPDDAEARDNLARLQGGQR
jgi:tetratricopeptide (TPR) repeat protein